MNFPIISCLRGFISCLAGFYFRAFVVNVFRVFVVIGLLIGCVVNLFCAGTTEMNFLKIPVGQRASGLAGAYTALSDEVNGIYFNPAGLARLKHHELSLGHICWVNQTYVHHLTYGHRLKFIHLALSAFYLTTSPINKVGIKQPFHDIFEPEYTGGRVNLYNILFKLALSKQLGNLYVGANVKHAKSIIDNVSYDAIVFDSGAIYTLRNLSFGFAIRNLGPAIKQKYSQNTSNLPTEFKLGVAYRPLGNLLFAADLSKAVDSTLIPIIGMEYTFKFLSLRIGYKTFPGYINNTGLSAGLGLNAKLGDNDLLFDYAATPFDKLGFIHQFSISLKFKPPEIKPAAEKPKVIPSAPVEVKQAPIPESIVPAPEPMKSKFKLTEEEKTALKKQY